MSVVKQLAANVPINDFLIAGTLLYQVSKFKQSQGCGTILRVWFRHRLLIRRSDSVLRGSQESNRVEQRGIHGVLFSRF